MTRQVLVVGGGPAGLMSAHLIARQCTGSQVTLVEGRHPGQTYGFGVLLSGDTMAALQRADAAVHADITAAAVHHTVAEIRMTGGRGARIPGFYTGASIARATLLAILARHAEASGVQLRTGEAADPADADAFSAGSADAVVVAADGSSSGLRERHAAEFGARVGTGRSRFLWTGCPVQLPGTVFMPVRTDAGLFIAHAYPYAPGWSTLVIEADESVLHDAGLATPDDPDGSEEASLAFLSRCFAELVEGRELVGNDSRWFGFRTVRCARWHRGQMVLAGDSAATAHPSLGSGTKLALESAATLAETLADAPAGEPTTVTLARYERRRRPAVERLQRRAQWSERWFEAYRDRLGLSPARAALSYLTRAGALTLDQIQRSSPELLAAAVAEWAGVPEADVPSEGLSSWALDRPFISAWGVLTSRVLDGRTGRPRIATFPVDFSDAAGAAGDELVAQVGALLGGSVAAGPEVIELTGESTPTCVLARLAMAERLRAVHGVAVAVAACPAQAGMVADGIAAGRADLLTLLDERGDPLGADAVPTGRPTGQPAALTGSDPR